MPSDGAIRDGGCMNHEARKIRLGQLTAQVRIETLKYTANPVPKPNSHARNELNGKIDGWMQRGDAIRRDLEDSLSLRRVSAPSASLAKEAFRASRGRQEKQEQAVRDAWSAPYAEFSAAIAELVAKVLGPEDPARTIVEAMGKGLKEIQKSMETGKSLQHHELTHIMQQRESAVATIQAAPAAPLPIGATPVGGVMSPVGILMVGLSVLAALKVRLGKRS